MTYEQLISVVEQQLFPLVLRHLMLVGVSVGLAVLIAVPVGIFLTRPRFQSLGQKVMSFVNIGQAVPSLAIIAIFMPLMGIGVKPAIIALVIYGLLPIARNTLAGLNSVEEDIKEAARGVGMSNFQVLMKIELPLASPIIIAGIRTSVVVTVGTAALAFLIGAGGLGRLIFTGIRVLKPDYLLVGSGSAALLAIIMDRVVGLIGKLLVPDIPEGGIQ
ncbi:MAG: ABC transporter permease [Halanaerobiaceae bacterium]